MEAQDNRTEDLLVIETEMTQIMESRVKVEHDVLCTVLISSSALFYSHLNPYKKAVE